MTGLHTVQISSHSYKSLLSSSHSTPEYATPDSQVSEDDIHNSSTIFTELLNDVWHYNERLLTQARAENRWAGRWNTFRSKILNYLNLIKFICHISYLTEEVSEGKHGEEGRRDDGHEAEHQDGGWPWAQLQLSLQPLVTSISCTEAEAGEARDEPEHSPNKHVETEKSIMSKLVLLSIYSLRSTWRYSRDTLQAGDWRVHSSWILISLTFNYFESDCRLLLTKRIVTKKYLHTPYSLLPVPRVNIKIYRLSSIFICQNWEVDQYPFTSYISLFM